MTVFYLFIFYPPRPRPGGDSVLIIGSLRPQYAVGSVSNAGNADMNKRGKASTVIG